MQKKTAALRERQARKAERGVAVNVIMIVDTDGRRGLASLDGQNVVWRSSWDECWRTYLRRETRMAKEAAAEKATQVEAEPVAATE